VGVGRTEFFEGGSYGVLWGRVIRIFVGGGHTDFCVGGSYEFLWGGGSYGVL